MTTTLTHETIVEMTQEIWTALLDGADLQPGGHEGVDLSATVSISGAWNGTACLSCSETAARHAAGFMFGLPADEIVPDDMYDAIGELINVVGGNIKGMLPNPTELSLPVVHADEPFDVPGHLELGYKVTFTWLEEPVMVTVWTSAPQ